MGAPRDCETFLTEPTEDGYISLQTFHGRYLTVQENPKIPVLGRLSQLETNKTEREKFKLESVGGDDMVTIRCVADNTYICAHATGQITCDETELIGDGDELFDVVGEDVGQPKFSALVEFMDGTMGDGKAARRIKKYLGNAIGGGKCAHQSADGKVRCDNLPAGSTMYCTKHTCTNPTCKEKKELKSTFCAKHEKEAVAAQGKANTDDDTPCCPCATSFVANYSPKVLAVKHPIFFSVVNAASV